MPSSYSSEYQLELFKKLMGNTPFVYYLLDKDWKFLLSMGKGLENIGFKPNEVVGLSVKDMYSDNEGILNSIASVYNGETVVTTTTDSTGSHYETFFNPVFDDKGEVEMLACLSMDITKRIEIETEIQDLTKNLEQKVVHRTDELRQSNLELASMNEELRRMNEENKAVNQHILNMQKQMVESEKMASLGGLVAGVAHEINTPLGISVTASSYLEELLGTLEASYQAKTLSKDHLENFFKEARKSTKLLNSNMYRATELISSFKQVAVDQTSEVARTINMSNYINEVIQALTPKLKKTTHYIDVQCPQDLYINIRAGEISQILTNLIMNTLIHGLDGKDNGEIKLHINELDGEIKILYSDNGKGVSEENLKQLFEPFFTTRRGQGGSGLGTHILYNLVTQSLNGSISAKSTLGKGLSYLISIPKKQD